MPPEIRGVEPAPAFVDLRARASRGAPHRSEIALPEAVLLEDPQRRAVDAHLLEGVTEHVVQILILLSHPKTSPVRQVGMRNVVADDVDGEGFCARNATKLVSSTTAASIRPATRSAAMAEVS